MVAVTGNAACSIALRNAAYRVIPLALITPVYDAAKKLAVGDVKSLVQRRADCLNHFAKLGISKERVCAAVECRAVEDIGLEHLETLIGYATALKDGEVKIDDVFPEPKVKMDPPAVSTPAAKPDTSNADMNGEPRPTREPANVDNMNKPELLAEIATFKDSPKYETCVLNALPEGCTTNQAPANMLRGMLTELRNN
jgi:hypothetical protein